MNPMTNTATDRCFPLLNCVEGETKREGLVTSLSESLQQSKDSNDCLFFSSHPDQSYSFPYRVIPSGLSMSNKVDRLSFDHAVSIHDFFPEKHLWILRFRP